MSNIDKHAVQAVADLKAGYTLGHADVAILNELARIALTSLEAEPVAWRMRYRSVHCIGGWVFSDTYGEPPKGYEIESLYTAPPAPVSVPDEDLLHMAASAIDDLLSNKDRSGAGVWADIPAKLRRAAMLQGSDGTLTNEGTIPVTQFKPVADLYGLTSPTGGETSFTFDAVEARDFIDGGWSCQEYVELGRYQEALTDHSEDKLAMVDHSGDSNNMVEPVTTAYKLPEGWVACSELMPGEVLAALQNVARLRRNLNDFCGDKSLIAKCLSEAEGALLNAVNRHSTMLAEPLNEAKNV